MIYLMKRLADYILEKEENNEIEKTIMTTQTDFKNATLEKLENQNINNTVDTELDTISEMTENENSIDIRKSKTVPSDANGPS